MREFDKVKKTDVELDAPKLTYALEDSSFDEVCEKLNSAELVALPGFCDVHVHFREPGFSYKETIATGSLAAAAGGYTAVCTMPNLKPVPDSMENLQQQLDIIQKDAVIDVRPFAAITRSQQGKELADMAVMAPFAAGFSDDGRGVQSEDMMREAMLKAKSLGKVISAHCEDNSLLKGGYIHDGEYARTHGHRGICSESEYAQIARDIRLVKETGCAYHVCHVSAKESVDIIRKAKAEGVNITCETAPHYLILDETNLREEGRFKMNPPLRSKDDMQALIDGVKDGTVDVIATDHAPHSREEKSKGLEKSAMGVVGLETAFPVLYTKLVKTGIITLEKLINMMSVKPREIFSIPGGRIEKGMPADLALLSLDDEWTVEPDEFVTMGRATPFEGWKVYGRNLLTICEGEIVYEAL